MAETRQITIEVEPPTIRQGGRVRFTATPTTRVKDWTPTWEILDIPNALVVDEDNEFVAYWDVPADQQPSVYTVQLTLADPHDKVNPTKVSTDVVVDARPFSSGDTVHLGRTGVAPTDDQAFWVAIRNNAKALSFNRYTAFIDQLMCGSPQDEPQGTRNAMLVPGRGLPFSDTDAYRLLKVATETFMMMNCGVYLVPATAQQHDDPFLGTRVEAERERLGLPSSVDQVAFKSAIRAAWRRYVSSKDGDRIPGEEDDPFLPYLAVIRLKLRDVPIVDDQQFGLDCYGILREKFTNPCLLELIWSYWHEEGMLVQTMTAISERFQNRRAPGDHDPLAHVEIDPLRTLNNLLWGYIQDEQHRLTAHRRTYEYDHHYGITLLPPAVPAVRGADSRSRFLEAFHNLLNLASVFFKEDDDTTVIADGFPVLNALKEVHLLLTEGQHNQYGDLPWTARQEMLMEQWLLARPEMRGLLPGRTMVAYPEPWMDRVDGMKRLQGWTDSSIIHFHELGTFGEQILLAIRFGNWHAVIDRLQAANWARYWRSEIQGYVHAYRAVTGVDLSADRVDTRVDATMPTLLLRRRLAEQLRGRRPMPPPPTGRAATLQPPQPAPSAPAPGHSAAPLPSAQPGSAPPLLPGRRAQLPPGQPSGQASQQPRREQR
ncbi:hypothetical protein E1264_29090 [Actinomadura sp. KC216]|uniref:hypothetical protein n=1 Tax=Actinomadura sp. KC216 TaxID=2530370 RepID=UPI00104614E0|nr:hypothetical protein [Actinomadura sp. KC216]TDB83269.1 hypothetical protein E1264_29090 [Actinomadura sp. KC216]